MKISFQVLFLVIIFSRVNIYSQPFIEQNSGVTVNLTSVCINILTNNYTGNNNAWVCGYNGTVLRTSNAGTNWLNVSGNGIPSAVNLANIFCVDTSTALTAGNVGTTTYLYRTTNKGISWTQVFTQSNGAINGVWMKSTSNGFMCGNPVGARWSLWKTTNGGVTWDSTGLRLLQAGNETGFNNSLCNLGNRIWFGTNNSRIYYTTNYGTNWQILSTPEANSTAIWFFFQDTTCGYFGGSVNSYSTTNYGNNWTTLSCPDTGTFKGFVWGEGEVNNEYPPMISFAVRNNGRIYQSDYFSSWWGFYTAPAGVYRALSNCYMNGPLCYAVRSNGGITAFSIFIGRSKKLSSSVPDKFLLFQNYPNPFNPSTIIKYQVLKNNNVKISLYNVEGKEIAVLVNEQETPGTYEVQFDAGRFSSGVYFYKLETPGFTEIKKMVLVK